MRYQKVTRPMMGREIFLVLDGCKKTESHILWTLKCCKWLFFLMITSSSLISELIVSRVHASGMETAIQTKASLVIEFKREYLKYIISQQERLVRTLVDSPFMMEYLSHSDKPQRDQLKQLFLAAATINRHYMQVRFIDINGQEQIRIEQSKNGSIPVIIKDNKLQDKSSREYFKATQKIPLGSLWHSPFDLNREQGAIESLINPTYRVASPVYLDSKFYGIVIINLDMTWIIKYLADSTDFLVYLVDSEGEFLVNPDSKYSWSKYLPGRSKYQQDQENKVKNHTHSLEDIFKNGEGIRIILKPVKAELL